MRITFKKKQRKTRKPNTMHGVVRMTIKDGTWTENTDYIAPIKHETPCMVLTLQQTAKTMQLWLKGVYTFVSFNLTMGGNAVILK